MTDPDYRMQADLEAAELGRQPHDVAVLLGRWINTETTSRGLAEIRLRSDGATLAVSVTAHGAPEPIDWGEVEAQLLYNLEEEGALRTVAVLATFELGFMTVELQIRVNRGVLAVAQFTVFEDGSGRHNYFTREFFHRIDG